MFTNRQESSGNEIEQNEDVRKLKLENEVSLLLTRKTELEDSIKKLDKQR